MPAKVRQFGNKDVRTEVGCSRRSACRATGVSHICPADRGACATGNRLRRACARGLVSFVQHGPRSSGDRLLRKLEAVVLSAAARQEQRAGRHGATIESDVADTHVRRHCHAA